MAGRGVNDVSPFRVAARCCALTLVSSIHHDFLRQLFQFDGYRARRKFPAERSKRVWATTVHILAAPRQR